MKNFKINARCLFRTHHLVDVTLTYCLRL